MLESSLKAKISHSLLKSYNAKGHISLREFGAILHLTRKEAKRCVSYLEALGFKDNNKDGNYIFSDSKKIILKDAFDIITTLKFSHGEFHKLDNASFARIMGVTEQDATQYLCEIIESSPIDAFIYYGIFYYQRGSPETK